MKPLLICFSGALLAHPTKGDVQHTLATVVQPRGCPRRTFLVFGKSGWIGGLLAGLLQQQGEHFVFADCRLQVNTELLRSRGQSCES
jgi:hypothetical protein